MGSGNQCITEGGSGAVLCCVVVVALAASPIRQLGLPVSLYLASLREGAESVRTLRSTPLAGESTSNQ